MAGNIQNLNLTKLIEVRENFRKEAYNITEHIVQINFFIQDLTYRWTGKRVNKVVNAWNNKYKEMEEYTLFIRKTFDAFDSIIEQYNKLELGKPVDINRTWAVDHWSGCFNVKLTDESTISYNKNAVASTIKEIDYYVEKIKSKLKNLQTILDNIQTYSDSLKSLYNAYKARIGDIQNGLVKLCNLISDEAKQAAKDVNVTEQYNEKDARRAATTSK